MALYVCNRRWERSNNLPYDPLCKACLNTYTLRNFSFDRAWPEPGLEGYDIGVMGWLQACRLAYVEGVAVLYGTNTFHLRGTYLFRHLSKVLLAERLAAISSVELIWDLRLWGTRCPSTKYLAEVHPPEPGLELYHSLVAAIPRIFPELKSLHIGLLGAPIYHGMPQNTNRCEMLLRPLDDMVRASPRWADSDSQYPRVWLWALVCLCRS